jgi:hypothetical protein
MCQISCIKLENAVQATKFINSTIYTPITPQAARNVLVDVGLWSAMNQKVPTLKSHHW